MNTKNQQIEFEVFPKDNKAGYSYLAGLKNDTTNEQGASINVAFSHQSVIVIFICVIMSLIACFSLGVEKGKLMAKSILPAPQQQAALAVQNLQSAPVTTPVPVATTQNENLKPTTNNMAIPPQAQPIALAVIAEKTTTPVVESGYAIQIASVKTKDSAKNLSESLIKKGTPSFTKSSGDYIIVLAGNFAKKEEAQIKLKELKKTYQDCFIKKI